MRLFGFATDPTSGGTTLDLLSAAEEGIEVPPITQFVPVTSAQVDPGYNQLDRNAEVRGRRGNTAPRPFSASPTLTFDALAYPKLLRPLIRAMLSGEVNSSGEAPAAIESTVEPIQSGVLMALVGWLLREDQLDYLTGLVVRSLELKLPIDQEGSVTFNGDALFHDVQELEGAKGPDGSALEVPEADYTGYEDTFMLRDALAFRGPEEGTEIADLAGITINFDNGLIEDFESKFRPGHNIQVGEIDGERGKLWFPERHKIGPQNVTGTIDLSAVDVSAERRRQLTHADKLVLEVSAGPLETTPPVDEMLRITIHKHAPTGGGAGPLVREGDQRSSFDFSGYIDPATNLDFEATFLGEEALT